MIERKIVKSNFLEFSVSDFIRKNISDVPIKDILVEKSPLGERITIYTSTPGLVIGREGSNIKKLTKTLKEKFKFENPQIKIGEVTEMFLSASIVSKRIANDLANFGPRKFKLTAFRALGNIMNSGAMGVEIKISGKVPSSRSKTWRFFKGYLKKTGYVSDFLVDHAVESVTLKSGVVGIKVSIMLPNTPLPDKIEYLAAVIPEEVIAKIEEEKVESSQGDVEQTKPKELKKTKDTKEVEVVKESKEETKKE
ncbi:MAG: 30S ribosomal protein S3 [Candidatus Woesearchaeota archaeon]|jgi:small subunit ribosomal protein S3|nr:30S ribosomal protein S3 [Candidatus Woesearchaeota archaeon]